MRVALAAAELHSKRQTNRQSKRDIERALPKFVADLNGLRSISLRRILLLAPGPAADQLFCVDSRDLVADGFRVRGLARKFLHLQSTRAAGQLSHSAKAAQGRADE